MSLPKTYKAAQVPAPGAAFEIVDRTIRTPAAGEVLIRVHASGVCYTDHVVQEGLLGAPFPRVPGHEIVGRVAALGAGVSGPPVGALVGIGWIGDFCGECDACRASEHMFCSERAAITGATHDGGHAEYVYAPKHGVVRIPEEALKNASYAELAPIMCAGITVYDALRAAAMKPGSIVAVQGIGGLGHLAIQYAAKMGAKVYALSSGDAKKDLALSLGAHEYINTSTTDAAAYFAALGGANVIISTVSDAEKIGPLVPLLRRNGKLMVVGLDYGSAGGAMHLNNPLMVVQRLSVIGRANDSVVQLQDCVDFTVLQGIKPIVQTFKLADFQKAYDELMHGAPNLRNVITFP